MKAPLAVASIIFFTSTAYIHAGLLEWLSQQIIPKPATQTYDPAHLEKLVTEGKCTDCNLQRINYVEAIKVALQSGKKVTPLEDVSGSNLSYAVFDFAHLPKESRRLIADSANFSKTNLQGAYFKGVLAYAINFSQANLTKAQFKDNELVNPNFTGANLFSAAFHDCLIYNVYRRMKHNFSECNLCSTTFNNTRCGKQFADIDFQFDKATFSRLTRFDRRSKVWHGTFTGATGPLQKIFGNAILDNETHKSIKENSH